MKFEIEEVASEAPILLRAFFAGFTDTGKSLHALYAAKALGGKTIVIDTESHTISRYSRNFPDWKFARLPLRDYSDDAYCEAIDLCIKKGYDNVVIDTTSKLWESKGGLTEQVEEQADDAQGRKTIQLGWNKAKNRARRVIDEFAKAPAHLIYTFRSTGDFVREGGKFVLNGEKLVFCKGIEYEFNCRGWIHVSENGDRQLSISFKGMKIPQEVTNATPTDFERLFGDFQLGKVTNIFEDMKALVESSTDKEMLKVTLGENKRWLSDAQVKELGGMLKAKPLWVWKYMYQQLSASSADRADLCPGSFALDSEKSEAGFFADRGTLVHNYLEKFAYSEESADEFFAEQHSEYNRCILASLDPEAILLDLINLVADDAVGTNLYSPSAN